LLENVFKIIFMLLLKSKMYTVQRGLCQKSVIGTCHVQKINRYARTRAFRNGHSFIIERIFSPFSVNSRYSLNVEKNQSVCRGRDRFSSRKLFPACPRHCTININIIIVIFYYYYFAMRSFYTTWKLSSVPIIHVYYSMETMTYFAKKKMIKYITFTSLSNCNFLLYYLVL